MESPQEVVVTRLGSGESELAVFEFEGQLRDLMVKSLREVHLATGNYARDARALSPQSALSTAVLGAAAGATALSAAFSSNLDMATAAPSTLMQIGGGVGSAVMGVNGIVGQAPFLAVAGALPTVAPILAIQALTTVIVLQQFEEVDRKLDAIKTTLDTAIARAEATHAGELLTASRIVDEIYAQYEECGRFSGDMLMRLALAERDTRSLAERFRRLVESHSTDSVDDVESVKRANYDAHSAMLGSFLALRVAYLRVCVDMQENPRSVDSSVKRLRETIESGIVLWEELLGRSESIQGRIEELQAKLDDMNWVEKSLPEFIGGRGAGVERKISALREAYVSTLKSERTIVEGYVPLITSAKQTLQELEKPLPATEHAPTLVYWKDEAGEHSFVTEQLTIA